MKGECPVWPKETAKVELVEAEERGVEVERHLVMRFILYPFILEAF